MDHHPHIHALVPGGGPSLDGEGWITSRHPTQRNRRKPYLVDNVLLGRTFRKKFTEGFHSLVRRDKLRLDEEWAKLLEPEELERWLSCVTEPDWNVFVEGPPNGKSNPANVLKYLARYMTGGPITDRRMISDEDGRVTFWARSKNKAEGNRRRPFTLRGKEFVRRWSMHILPKGYTRSRTYGGYHGSSRRDYLRRCRESLSINDSPVEAPEPIGAHSPTCIRCELEMDCIDSQRRPSWREVFKRGIYADPTIYSPMHHIDHVGFAPLAHEPYG